MMAKLLKPSVKWNGKTVALDDGHGMYTPGKRTPYIKSLGRQIHENEFNRAVVKFLSDLLLAQGFRVLLVAPTDADTPLKARTDAANAHKADIYVSIHYNAVSHDFKYSNASGISVHIYPGHRGKAAGKLAESVGKHLRKGTKQVWRGIKEDNFHVLRETHMPSILTENGFMDDEREALLMLDVKFQREVANEHFLGIMEYFGLSVKATAKPSVKPAQTEQTTKKYASVVDYLKAHGKDSSFVARAELAKQHGIAGYKGTAEQNLRLLDKLQNGSKPKKSPTHKPMYVGKRVESIHQGPLRFYSRPSWDDKHVAGHLLYGYGFPLVIDKVRVDNAYQYKVKNSKGQVYYVTASPKYVRVE